MTQNPVAFGPWGFDSPLRHHTYKGWRTALEAVRSCFRVVHLVRGSTGAQWDSARDHYGDAMQDDNTSGLSTTERSTLGFMIDLEDRGSEWPDLRRIINYVGVTFSAGESLLLSLEERGYVDLHPNLHESSTRYAITPSGRACFFHQSQADE